MGATRLGSKFSSAHWQVWAFSQVSCYFVLTVGSSVVSWSAPVTPVLKEAFRDRTEAVFSSGRRRLFRVSVRARRTDPVCGVSIPGQRERCNVNSCSMISVPTPGPFLAWGMSVSKNDIVGARRQSFTYTLTPPASEGSMFDTERSLSCVRPYSRQFAGPIEHQTQN